MEIYTDATTNKLFKAFMQFRKAEWHHHTAIEGCKPSEVRVLFCIQRGMLADAPEIKVSDISRLLHVTSPTVTQLLKGLEANGMIERHHDPNDRRTVGIRLTAKGEEITKKAHEAFKETFQGLADYLGEEDSNQLADLLTRVFHYFHEQEISTYNSQWNGEEEI